MRNGPLPGGEGAVSGHCVGGGSGLVVVDLLRTAVLVLLALSGADRRRQREVDAAQHLLECDLCARLSQPLLDRGPVRDDEVQVTITGDPDIVAARQAARELAVRAGFTGTDLTLLATAVSENCTVSAAAAGP